jgi:hypothetical protein
MVRLLRAAGVLLALVGLATLAAAMRPRFLAAPDPPTPPRVLTWDFSGGRGIERVGWPADYPSTIWFPGRADYVSIRLPGGRASVFHNVEPVVYRSGANVHAVTLPFAAVGPDSARNVAAGLSRTWDLDGDNRLDVWREFVRTANLDRTDSARRNFVLEGPAGVYPRWGVGIRWTYDDRAPWAPQWGVVLAADK